MRKMPYEIWKFFVFVFLFIWGGSAIGAKAPDVMVFNKCLKCHEDYKTMKDIVAGDFYSRSRKAKSISVKVDNKFVVLKYEKDTTIKNVPNIKKLKKPVPVLVHYKKVGQDLVATSIIAKPKFKVPEKQLIETQEFAKLVAQGPSNAGYTLVDSRPGIRYREGHIPTAISIPFPKMKDLKDKLPKDKNRLLIFYCGGVR